MASSSTSQLQTGTTTQQGTSTTGAQAPATTAQTNIEAVPGLGQLTSLINSIQQGAQQQANVGRLPGGQQALNTATQAAQSNLSGNLPPDILALLQQQGGEMGVSTGQGPGAPSTNAALLRALGITSNQLQQQGFNEYGQLLAENPSAPIFNPSQYLVTPSQAGTTTTNQGTQSNVGQTNTSTQASEPAQPANQPPSQAPQSIPGADSWWNSLFPQNNAGVTYTGAGSTTIPGMEGYLGVTGAGGPNPAMSDYWNQPNLDVMGNPTQQNFDAGSYDPFAQYAPDQATALSTGTEGADIPG